MTDSPCCGDQGSRERDKNAPLRSRSSQAHGPAVLIRFPSASGFLQTGQHNSEEIFHDIKEYHESCSTAGARSENKLSDLIQTVTYFFQKRSVAQVFTENGAACSGRDPRLSRLGFPDRAHRACACSRGLLNARRKDSGDPNIKSGPILQRRWVNDLKSDRHCPTFWIMVPKR